MSLVILLSLKNNLIIFNKCKGIFCPIHLTLWIQNVDREFKLNVTIFCLLPFDNYELIKYLCKGD